MENRRTLLIADIEESQSKQTTDDVIPFGFFFAVYYKYIFFINKTVI